MMYVVYSPLEETFAMKTSSWHNSKHTKNLQYAKTYTVRSAAKRLAATLIHSPFGRNPKDLIAIPVVMNLSVLKWSEDEDL